MAQLRHATNANMCQGKRSAVSTQRSVPYQHSHPGRNRLRARFFPLRPLFLCVSKVFVAIARLLRGWVLTA